LQSDRNGADEKSFYHRWRGSRKFSVEYRRIYDEGMRETLAEGASGLQHQGNKGGPLNHSQFVVLVPLFILALPGGPKRARGAVRSEGRRRRRMGDGEIQDEGDPIQGEAKIRSLTVLSAGLRNGLQASLTKERNEKLQYNSMARGDRASLKTLTRHEMIW